MKYEIDLTEREAGALSELLGMVLGNGDQWAFMDLRALGRVNNKIYGVAKE